jgi:hypothetical protein
MAVTAEQIRAWIASNPNASTAQIQTAMTDNGVSSQMLASVLGTQPLLNAPAEVQVMQYNNWSQGAPALTNDANRASIMQRFGLTPQEAAQYSKIPVEEIQKRYDTGLAQATAPITSGKVTDQQIATYLAGNPNAPDAQLSALMTQYGVTPLQMSRVTGGSIPDIEKRLAAVTQAQAENIPTGLAGFESSIKKGLADTTKTLRDAETLSRQDLSTSQKEVDKLYDKNITGLQDASTVAAQDLTSAQKEVAKLYGKNITGLQDASTVAAKDLSTSQNEVARLYGKNITGLQDAGNVAAQDLTSAQEQVAKLYGLNIADIQAAGTKARSDVEGTFKTAGSYYTPYQQAGTQALSLQQALSGASGQQAFDQAYQESPYIAFLREQGMRANLAGASATGGLGGGNVQKELNRFGQGLASQGLQQQIGNLQNLSAQGLNAAGGAAGVQTGLGTNLANLGTGVAGNVSNQRGALAGFESGTGTNLANLRTGTASNIANQGSQLAGYESGTGTNLANLRTGTASNIANQGGQLAGYESGTGTNLANLRTGTASNIANQGSQLAGYVSGTGVNLANIGQQTGANIANFQGSAASGLATQRMNAGISLQNQIDAATTNLARLAETQGTNFANAYQNQTGAVQNLNTGAANAYAGNTIGLANQQSSVLGGQQYTPNYVPDYAQQYANVFNAGSAGYELGGMAGQPNKPTTTNPNLVVNPSAAMNNPYATSYNPYTVAAKPPQFNTTFSPSLLTGRYY